MLFTRFQTRLTTTTSFTPRSCATLIAAAAVGSGVIGCGSAPAQQRTDFANAPEIAARTKLGNAVPEGFYGLEASVGGQTFPIRLELLSIDGRPWGRMTLSVGTDLLVAVRGKHAVDQSWDFAVGGPIRGMQLQFAESVTGTIDLRGSAIPVQGSRTGDLEAAAVLRAHHALTPLGLAARAGEDGASFPTGTPDGSLIFTRHGGDLTMQTLVIAPSATSGWQDPRDLFEPHPHSDRSPFVLPDGSGIIFASNRPLSDSASGTYRLWFASRTGAAWSAPMPLQFDGDWDHDARQPAVTLDGTLYFSSNAPGGLGETDIWMADRVAPGRWGAPRNLGAPINGPSEEHGAFVAPDGSWMIVTSSSERPGHLGGDDLWLSRRTSGGWSPPAAFQLPVNTFGNEYGAWVSPIDDQLYFTSDRYGNADVFRVSVRAAGLPTQR